MSLAEWTGSSSDSAQRTAWARSSLVADRWGRASVMWAKGGRVSRGAPAMSHTRSRTSPILRSTSMRPCSSSAEKADGLRAGPSALTRPSEMCRGRSEKPRAASNAAAASADETRPRKATVMCKSSRPNRRTQGGGANLERSTSRDTGRATNQLALTVRAYPPGLGSGQAAVLPAIVGQGRARPGPT